MLLAYFFLELLLNPLDSAQPSIGQLGCYPDAIPLPQIADNVFIFFCIFFSGLSVALVAELATVCLVPFPSTSEAVCDLTPFYGSHFSHNRHNDAGNGIYLPILLKGVETEILDVDGACGGYNLQWAWTSARIAAEAASQSCHET